MRKNILFLSIIFLLLNSSQVFSKVKKRHKKSRQIASLYKTKKFKKKKHGNGPDLKEITKNSPFIENPSNGVNPIETNNSRN